MVERPGEVRKGRRKMIVKGSREVDRERDIEEEGLRETPLY